MLRRLRAIIMVTFGFSRTETRAFVILLPLVFMIVFSRPIYQALFWPKESHLFNGQQLDSLLATLKWSDSDSINNLARSLFRFDPNKVSKAEMDSLGIPTSLARRVERYRSRGGTFRIRSDLKKIYGFDSALFVRL